jgi:uncharacterized protein DUF4303
MTAPTDAELTDAWTTATRNAVTALFAEYPDHHFYWISMMVSDETYPPFLVPVSEEQLAQLRVAAPDYDKWDYSFTPLVAYGHEEHYGEVHRLLELRPDLEEIEDDDEWDAEFEARMAAVEASMVRLDAEGLFGVGAARDGVVILVENMPPLPVDTQRALRLNPPSELFQEWLRDVAEVEVE